jgi:hypothetical protein
VILNKEVNPRVYLYLFSYFVYQVQIKIQKELSLIPIPKCIPLEDDHILVLWSNKKENSLNEKWELVMHNRLYQEKLYKIDDYPGVTLVIGKNSRIEIDSLIGCYQPLYNKKIVNLSKDIIDKLYKSGMMRRHPELLRLVPFEGYSRRDKAKNNKSSDKTSDKTSKNKKGEKAKVSNEDQETEVIGLESMDD